MARQGSKSERGMFTGAALSALLLGLIGAQGCGQILGVTEVQGTGPGGSGGGATTTGTSQGGGGHGGTTSTTTTTSTTGTGGNGGNPTTTTSTGGSGGATTGTGGSGGGCNTPADCPGSSTACLTITCTAQVCGSSKVAAGTALPAASQLLHDCLDVVCDGQGNVDPTPVANDGDLPDDGNDCTTDTCSGGVPKHTNKNAGSPCGNGQTCVAGGQCGCANNGDCTPPATCGGGNPGTPNVCGCTKKTCAGVGATCGLVADGCAGMLLCDDGIKNGTETDVDCGGGCATQCATGKLCSAAGDCLSAHCVDGVCCASTCSGECKTCNLAGKLGTCSDVPSGQVDPGTCAAPNSCDGGGNCQKPNGTACSSGETCQSNKCVDGYCCNAVCTGACLQCNQAGKLGICSNVATGQPDNNPAGVCTGTSACNGAGACKKASGQPCAQNSDCASGTCLGNNTCQ